MNYLEKWKMRKAKEERIRGAERAEEDRISKTQEKGIISVLITDFGLRREDIHTSGYWFHFHYKGLFIDFVKQTGRLCVEMYRPPSNEDEEKCLRDATFIKHTDEFPEFQKEFNYRSAVLYGSPIATLRKIMELAELPIEKVDQWIHEMKKNKLRKDG